MKNVLTTITLAATLAFGSTFAFADGIIVGDRGGIIVGDKSAPCVEVKDNFVDDIIGLLEGIIVGDRGGIIVGDRNCNATEGIIVGDRTEGIIVGD